MLTIRNAEWPQIFDRKAEIQLRAKNSFYVRLNNLFHLTKCVYIEIIVIHSAIKPIKIGCVLCATKSRWLDHEYRRKNVTFSWIH